MRASEIKPKMLVIFDIDDTLVHTQTEVNVIKDGNVVKSLNSHEFTHYKLQPGESFDFENFRNAREFFDNHKPIIPMMNQLKRDIARGNKVVMVTARADFDDKELFLDTFRKYNVDIDKVHVYRAGNLKSGSTEERKRQIIKTLLDKDNYTRAVMYDDAKPNLELFVSLKKDHPRTMFYAWHVDLEGNASEYMREDIQHMDLDEGIIDSIVDFIKPYIEKAQGKLRKLREAIKREWWETGLMWEIIQKGNKAKDYEIKFANDQFKDMLKGVGLGAWLALPIPGNTLWITLLEKLLNKFDVSIMPDSVKQVGVFDNMNEKWSAKYKRSINCNNPKGFSQKAHCAGRKKNEDIEENFADGKVKGKSRPGRVKKAGASCNGSVTSLRKRAKNASGEKAKMYHWCANMKSGRNKK